MAKGSLVRQRRACETYRMPKRSSSVPPRDTQPSSADQPSKAKNPAAVALGRRGGLKGGKARMERLSKEERSALGKKAAAARWEKK